MNNWEQALIPATKEGVRIVFPLAVLKTDGHMYWIESLDASQSAVAPEIISRRSATPYKAWRSALEFSTAR